MSQLPSKPKFLIYGLIDPRDGQLRYVGKSSNGLKRARSHGYPAVLSRDRTWCGNWIHGLLAAGSDFEVEVIETHPSHADLPEAEQFWIAYFRSIGARLTNLTDGGEGPWGRRNSMSTRLKMSAARGGLDEVKREESVRLYRSGLPLREVARRFETGSKVIYRILLLAGERLRTRSEARLAYLSRSEA